MSSSFQETPNGEVGTGRVAKYPLVDLASVEHADSTARVAEAWKNSIRKLCCKIHHPVTAR